MGGDPEGSRPLAEVDRSAERLLGKDEADVIVLGSGSSSGSPNWQCVLPPAAAFDELQPERKPQCNICAGALQELLGTESTSMAPRRPYRLYRTNPSVVFRVPGPDGRRRHVQIDCGKTFRDQALRWYPYYGIPTLDAVIITHDHADAVLGLDDIRGLQRLDYVPELGCNKIVSPPIEVICETTSAKHVRSLFPYLFPPPDPAGKREASSESSATAGDCEQKAKKAKVGEGGKGEEGGEGGEVPAAPHGACPSSNGGCGKCGEGTQPAAASQPQVHRHVASVRLKEWRKEDMLCKQTLCDGAFSIIPFYVYHGRDYPHMLGFAIPIGGRDMDICRTRVIYLSDITEVGHADSLAFLESLRGRVDLLFLDSLYAEKEHATHMNVKQAMEFVRWLRPAKTLLLGLSHDFEGESVDKELNVYLAQDGLRVPL